MEDQRRRHRYRPHDSVQAKRHHDQEWRDGPLAPSTFEVPFTVNDVERDFNSTRTPTADELKGRYVHAYDRGASTRRRSPGWNCRTGSPFTTRMDRCLRIRRGWSSCSRRRGLVTIVVPEQQDWRVPFLLNPAGLQFTTPKPLTTARLDRAVKLGLQADHRGGLQLAGP